MKNELKSTKDKILLLKNQLEVLGINKKSASSSTNVDTRAFKATIEFYRDEIFVLENDKEIHKALNVMITLYDYYYNSNITTSIEDNNYLAVITKKNDYVDELKYFVTYTLQHLRATTKVNEFRISFINYVLFRCSNTIVHLLRDAPRMNSTSPISNLKEIYSNSNKIEIYSNVFLPLKHTLQGKSYEKSLSLNREFDESK